MVAYIHRRWWGLRLSYNSKHRKHRTHKPSLVSGMVHSQRKEHIRLSVHMLEQTCLLEPCRTTSLSTPVGEYREYPWRWNRGRYSWRGRNQPIQRTGTWPFGPRQLWMHCTVDISDGHTVIGFYLVRHTADCFWGTFTSVALTDAVKITLPCPCFLKIRAAAWAV